MTTPRQQAPMVLATVLLVAGLLAVVVSVGQRLGLHTQIGLAERQADRAAEAVELARSQTQVATEQQNAAAAEATRAVQDRDDAEADLAAGQQRVSELDYPGRLDVLEQMVAISLEQADRFTSMNEAALVDDVATYNRLADESNTFIAAINELWAQVVTEDSGFGPADPVV